MASRNIRRRAGEKSAQAGRKGTHLEHAKFLALCTRPIEVHGYALHDPALHEATRFDTSVRSRLSAAASAAVARREKGKGECVGDGVFGCEMGKPQWRGGTHGLSSSSPPASSFESVSIFRIRPRALRLGRRGEAPSLFKEWRKVLTVVLAVEEIILHHQARGTG